MNGDLESQRRMWAQGQVLRRWRLQRGLTQAELAQAASVGQGYISDLERGAIDDPGAWRLDRVLRGLGHTWPQLVRGTQREMEAMQKAGHSGQPRPVEVVPVIGAA